MADEDDESAIVTAAELSAKIAKQENLDDEYQALRAAEAAWSDRSERLEACLELIGGCRPVDEKWELIEALLELRLNDPARHAEVVRALRRVRVVEDGLFGPEEPK